MALYKKKIQGLLGRFDIFDQRWAGCQGSTPKLRGYSCGLWTLFHFLTVRASYSTKATNKLEVLITIVDYVKHFYECTECAQNFQEMAAEDIWKVTTKNEAILWLWKAHNTVNDRIKGDCTEDPAFPKIRFPSEKNCPLCSEKLIFHEDDVLTFLKTTFSNGIISNFGMNNNLLPDSEDGPPIQ